jgi:hypothetical protein
LDLELDLVWQPSEALVALVPPMSIEDRPLLWIVVRSQLIILSTYLLMGVKRLVTLLSWVLALFGPTFRGGY